LYQISKVQLPHKIVHEELALQWLVLHGSARELAMANLWYVSVYILCFAALSINLVLVGVTRFCKRACNVRFMVCVCVHSLFCCVKH
jgi:hypothetical protein